MRVRAWDQGFVAVAPGVVYAALSDPAGYESWWPGARVRARDQRTELRVDRGPTLAVGTSRLRDGVGLFLEVAGAYSGTLEWHLEPFEEGTIVNCLLDLEIPGGDRRSGRRLLALRRSIHRGLVGLKGALE